MALGKIVLCMAFLLHPPVWHTLHDNYGLDGDWVVTTAAVVMDAAIMGVAVVPVFAALD